MSYRQLAAKYVRRQAKLLAKQLDGVRAAEDIEFVHRARVATRRLRAALKMFAPCFAKKKVKRWRNAMRQVAASLGDARDRDVQIDFLCGTLSSLAAKECFPGVARVLVQLERDRERLQRKVVRAVNRLEAEGTLRAMRRAAGRVLAKASASAEGSSEGSPLPKACEPPEQHILRRLAALQKYQACLADPTDCRRHHAMRIAAKRLRYTLEILRPLYPCRLDECVEATKTLQSLLGEIHDSDVWADHLAAFAAVEYDRILKMFGHAGRFLHLHPGIVFLQEDRLRHRRQTFEKLAEYWAELDRRRFWDQLRTAVHVDLPPF
jgi:CHAD domain-containing protein